MKASDAVAIFLARHQVRYCFELIGGMITHLVDSLATQGQVEIISMHHEQAAAFAAEGVSRSIQGSGLGVAMGTSGPGATNLITGIGSCWFDSVPCLFITGQVNTNELKGACPVRQQGFQELDIVALVGSITKFAAQVTNEEELLPLLHRALSVALSGRRGPVLLDIPNNIQRMEIPDDVVTKWLDVPLLCEEPPAPTALELGRLAALCAQAARPLVVFGGGAKESARMDAWLADLERLGIPYVSTLMGQERIPSEPHYFHMIGSYGNREANWALQHCDLLIVLGARLDIRQTGADMADFARQARIVQVDIDPGQIDNRIKVALPICASIDAFYRVFLLRADTFTNMDPGWFDQLERVRQDAARDEYPDWEISPYRLMETLNSAMSGKKANYVCDVGNHQMWAAQSLRLGPGQTIHHSGGMGAMGFALPAAIGMALGTEGKTIVIAGDGGIQVNIQEIDTVRRLNLDVAILVLNNRSLGMVKNFQDMYFDGRDRSTRQGYSAPPFVEIARAYGIPAERVTNLEDARKAMARMASHRGPLLVEVVMEGATECRPRLAFGSKLDEQYPRIDIIK